MGNQKLYRTFFMVLPWLSGQGYGTSIRGRRFFTTSGGLVSRSNDIGFHLEKQIYGKLEVILYIFMLCLWISGSSNSTSIRGSRFLIVLGSLVSSSSDIGFQLEKQLYVSKWKQPLAGIARSSLLIIRNCNDEKFL